MAPVLRARDKLLYGVADFGNNLVGVVGNTWLLYYLINVARLPPLQAGLAFLAGRLFDALVDPQIGALTDRLRPRLGRLHFVRVFALPAGLVFALLWLIPYAPAGWRLALAVLGFMALSVLYSLAAIPYLALGPELTPDYDERTSLNSYRMACSMLATLAGVALPPLVVLGVTGARDLAASPPLGWLVVGVGSALLITLSLFVTALGVREPRRPPGSPSGQAPAPPLNLTAIRGILSTFGLASLLGLFVLSTLAFMITNSLLPFFLESVLRLPAALQAPVLGTLFLSAIASFPLWVWLSGHLSKRAGVLLGLLLLMVSLLAFVYLVPRGGVSPLLWAALLLNGLGLSAVTLFPWAMLPDVIEFDELRSRLRREGLFYALLLLCLKAAGSLGVFSNALVTSVLGYQSGQALQRLETVRGLELMMGPVSVALFALAWLCAWRYPITRHNHAQARAQLDAALQSPAATSPRQAPAAPEPGVP